MKKIIVWLIVIMVLLTGCTNDKNLEKVNNEEIVKEEKTKMYESYDRKITFKFPISWKVLENKKILNKNANLEVEEVHKYFVLISQEKNKYFNTFKKYTDYVVKENSKIYEKESNVLNDLENNKQIKYIDYTKEIDGVNIFLRNYMIEGTKSYHQVLLWGLYSEKESLKTEFDNIIISYVER